MLHVDDYMQLLCSLWGVKQSHTFKFVTTERLQTQWPGLIIGRPTLAISPQGCIRSDLWGEAWTSNVWSQILHIMMSCGHTFIKSICVSALVVSLHVLYFGEPIRWNLLFHSPRSATGVLFVAACFSYHTTRVIVAVMTSCAIIQFEVYFLTIESPCSKQSWKQVFVIEASVCALRKFENGGIGFFNGRDTAACIADDFKFKVPICLWLQ